jgi:hypothetical protein
MTSSQFLDAAGRRRSPATMPGLHRGQPPRNKGTSSPQDSSDFGGSLPNRASGAHSALIEKGHTGRRGPRWALALRRSRGRREGGKNGRRVAPTFASSWVP